MRAILTMKKSAFRDEGRRLFADVVGGVKRRRRTGVYFESCFCTQSRSMSPSRVILNTKPWMVPFQARPARPEVSPLTILGCSEVSLGASQLNLTQLTSTERSCT